MNAFENTIILRIPNRFSIYDDYGSSYAINDGWVEFEVKGVLITPLYGQVYYTSDIDSFIEGTAQTSGHYFYVDTDLNGFYETVYVLEESYTSSRSGMSKYNVITIGYNYDGIHDFAPYEKLDKQMHTITDFSNLARESTMFGADWVYNFNNLRNNALLFEQGDSVWDQYKPKDHLFEIHKLVEKSSKNREFSQLFYEIRHKTYSEAWRQYRTQLMGDIVEQVFMTVTAFVISSYVEGFITGLSLAYGYALAKIASALTYLTVYTLLTKFFVDIKIHEAESRTRSQTFYPASNDVKSPISLNEKMDWDRLLQDSMAAALIGHPGGYYTTVSGGEHGNRYTAQLLVSPPNIARSANSMGGLLELLWENFWGIGESDPDSFYSLDFDDMNLDYFLLASELPSYNYRPNYSYPNTNLPFNDYNAYALNTLGYLETQVRHVSNNTFNAIRPTIIDGEPHYEFINREDYQRILPRSGLYQPIVLSQEKHSRGIPTLGHLIVQVRCTDYSNTGGVNAYDMDSVELEVGYKAKIPINDNGFEYPIRFISIDVVTSNGPYNFIREYYAQDLIINESYYTIDQGNLYFTKSLEELIYEQYSGFDEALESELFLFYQVHIYFDIVVPDDTEETHSLALTQATQHVVMDYFNQFMYAQVTANMISEIAYTETLTFWSTVISSAALYFSMGTSVASVGGLASAGVGIVKSAIKEVFEEIIKDAFIEALIENTFDILGWSENAALWVSALATSARETAGALGQLARTVVDVRIANKLKNDIALFQDALNSGEMGAIIEIGQRIEQAMERQQERQRQSEEQKSVLARLVKSGFFKGLFMVMPAILFGSYNFMTLKGLSNIGKGAISLAPQKFAAFKAKMNAFKKGKIDQLTGQNSQSSLNLEDLLKVPSELNSKKEDVSNAFKDGQESEVKVPLLVRVLRSINSQSNPNDIQSRQDLADKFNTIAFEEHFNKWIEYDLLQDERFKAFKEEFEKIQSNYRKIGVQKAEKDIIDIIKKALSKPGNTELRFVNMFGVEFYDPDFILLGVPPGSKAKIQDNKILGDTFKTSITSLDKVNELKDLFDIDVDLNLYVLKGEETTKIPINDETELTKWLKDNDFSNDQQILVVPETEPVLGQPRFNLKNINPGELNPYIISFNDFITTLGTELKSWGLIDKSSSSAVDYITEIDNKILSKLQFTDGKFLMQDIKNTMTSSPNTYIGQNTINKWQVLIADAIINSKSLSLDQKKAALDTNMNIFGDIYQDYGYTTSNSYFRKAHLTLENYAILLYKENIIEKPYITLLADIMGYSRSGRELVEDLLNRESPNSVKTINLRYQTNPQIFLTNFFKAQGLTGNLLDQRLKDMSTKTDEIISPYRDLSQSYEDSEDNILLNLKDKSQKRNLFSKIIHSGPIVGNVHILEKLSSKAEFSKLLFGDDRFFYDLTDKNNIDSPLFMDTLARMKFVVSHWQASDFLNLNSEVKISEYDVARLRTAVISEIDRFIYKNPYKRNQYDPQGNLQKLNYYIEESFTKHGKTFTKKDLIPDFKLSNALYYATMERLYAEYKRLNPHSSIIDIPSHVWAPTMEQVSNELGIGAGPFQRLRPGKNYPNFYTKRSLEPLLQTLLKWHFDHFDKQDKISEFEFGNRQTGLYYDRNDQDLQRMLYYYQNAIKSIYDYAKTKKIDLTSPTLSSIKLIDGLDAKTELIMNNYQITQWAADATKSFHIIYHLTKYLGFDPMTFTALDDNIFSGGTRAGSYRRHHFLALMFRKMSSHVNDILLTSVDLHNSEYETFLKKNGIEAEVKVKLLMQSLNELIGMKDQNGNYLKITEAHMREVLYKNFGPIEGEKILKKWQSQGQSGFVLSLQKFNDRRLDVFSGDYKQYLIDDYNNAYNAYYKIFSKVTPQRFLATQSNLDFLSMIYGIPFTLRPVQTKI